MPRWPGFIGGSGIAQSVIADAEDTINLYVEQLKASAALLPSPGFRQWTPLSKVADVGSRAAIVASGRLFWVMGGSLWEFDANGTPTKRAVLAQDGNPARLVSNGIVGGQLGIASGGYIYSYTLATDTLNGPHLGPGYTHLAYAAGYGLALNPTTGKVNVSLPDDLTMWSAGTFFQRSLFADPYQAMFVDANNLVWLPGLESFEVRYLGNPSADQPFAPLSGLSGRFGIVAPFAFGVTGLGCFWLARNPDGVGQFVVTQGEAPQPVSTYAFHTAIASYLRSSRIDDAEVVSYQAEGHTFLNVVFPAAQAVIPTTPTTWAFDETTKDWTKRGRWDGEKGKWTLWSPRVHVYAFNKHLVGDRTTGSIYEMDSSITTEIDGSGIVRERTAPGITDEHKRRPIDQIELFMDSGLGTNDGQGVDPIVTLRVSEDGGRTYGNELRASIGRMGQFGWRVVWTQLGAPANAVIKVRFSDPAPFRIIDVWINNAERVA